ncbi:hypothetical protein T265_07316 [Opisthorchis viverrini]|uniref:Fibronectin type-III domain-containing protein n=1 Tax=Opisthorchis viverrini TaxID=6198 RepID=A0A074ZD70_OPIVI|nr:hypothetical protein T265_07316 [Opisthorchis viverrini]KER25216.1 hypothetical protein T265_07316 [Opisthorchis viverrini]
MNGLAQQSFHIKQENRRLLNLAKIRGAFQQGKTLFERTRDCVYKINCNDCAKVYVRQTARELHTRIGEHKRRINKPPRNAREYQTLGKDSAMARLIAEAVEITKHHSVNRIVGVELASVWKAVLDKPILESEPPLDVQVIPNHEESYITVTWRNSATCQSTKYDVLIYSSFGFLVEESHHERSPVRVTNVRKCVPVLISVRKSGPWGVGQESGKKEVRLLEKPTQPRNLVVQLQTDPPGVRISWKNNGACAFPEYVVNVYSDAGTSIQSMVTNETYLKLSSLPMCGNLIAGLVARNSVGQSPETKSSPFSIPAVPRPPTNIQLRSSANYPNPAILWDYEGACAATHFVVDIYNSDDQLIKSFNVTASPAELLDLPTCALLTAGVSAHNTAGSSSMTKGSEFTIATGNAPQVPTLTVSVLLSSGSIWVQAEHKVDGNSGTAPT